MPELIAARQEITQWAPIVSCDYELKDYVGNLDFDYEDLREFLSQLKILPEQLQRVWIHLSSKPIPRNLQTSGFANASFTGCKYLDKEKVKSLKEYLGIPGTVSFDDKSFVLIDIPQILGHAPDVLRRYEGGSQCVSESLMHEIMHFEEYIETSNRAKIANSLLK